MVSVPRDHSPPLLHNTSSILNDYSSTEATGQICTKSRDTLRATSGQLCNFLRFAILEFVLSNIPWLGVRCLVLNRALDLGVDTIHDLTLHLSTIYLSIAIQKKVVGIRTLRQLWDVRSVFMCLYLLMYQMRCIFCYPQSACMCNSLYVT